MNSDQIVVIEDCVKCEKYKAKNYVICPKCGVKFQSEFEERNFLLNSLKDSHTISQTNYDRWIKANDPRAQKLQQLIEPIMYYLDSYYYTQNELYKTYPLLKYIDYSSLFREENDKYHNLSLFKKLYLKPDYNNEIWNLINTFKTIREKSNNRLGPIDILTLLCGKDTKNEQSLI